jgi:hypothetical protein
LARNRYGWNKRTKEIARKQKSEEKIKRHQGKALTPLAEEMPEVIEEETVVGANLLEETSDN